MPLHSSAMRRFQDWARRFSGPRLSLVLLWLFCHPAAALVFLTSSDPDHNTTPPTGALTNSGWETQQLSGYGATAIGPNQVLTASHLNIGAGSHFLYHGIDYPVLGSVTPPDADIRLFWVAGRLPAWAPLYRGSNELDSMLVFHGFGGPKGDPVYVTNQFNQKQQRGWLWTGSDGRMRWGTNTVLATAVQGYIGTNNMASVFNSQYGPDVITFSTGDSGGGIFIYDTDGVWKLAGVVSSVESSYRYTATGATFRAALFDRRGLYEEISSGVWGIPSDASSRPGSVLLTPRVSVYASWIDEQMAATSPGDPIPKLLASPTLSGPFTEVSAYSADPATKRITAPMDSSDSMFYQLEGVDQIQAFSQSGGSVYIEY